MKQNIKDLQNTRNLKIKNLNPGKTVLILLTLIILAVCAVPMTVSASDLSGSSQTSFDGLAGSGIYIFDSTDSLSDSTVERCDEYGEKIYDEYGIAVCYVRVYGKNQSELDSYILNFAKNRSADCVVLGVSEYSSDSCYYTLQACGSPAKFLTESDKKDIIRIYDEDESYYGGITSVMDRVIYYGIKSGTLESYYAENDEDEQANASDARSPYSADYDWNSYESVFSGMNNMTSPDHRLLPRVVDEADLMTSEEEAALLAQLDEASERLKFDIVVITVDSLPIGYTPMSFADDVFDYYGYGFGSDADGVILVISMEERDWYISTCGYGIYAFTDAGIDWMGEKIVPDLSEGDYYEAFALFGTWSEDFVTHAREDEPYDYFSMPWEGIKWVWLPIGLVVGLVISFIYCYMKKENLTSVAPKGSAYDYIEENSLDIRESEDLFLYSVITSKVRESSSGGGSSGGSRRSGSSHHSSSSGRSHGGGGGHF